MNPRLKTLLAGAALIALANVVALTGVYLNRSGEPESRLQLSQRELGHPWGWRGNKENSGLTLNLQWRVIDPLSPNSFTPYYGDYGGNAAWLDERRMAELGFDVTAAKNSDTRRRTRYESQSQREVLVVLELAGPSWELALSRGKENLTRQETARQVNPDAKEFIQREKSAQEQLQREEEQSSRLFAIDAGLDLVSLRAKYPDRSRYMILKGMVRPRLINRDKQTLVGGHISQLKGTQINVPYALRPVFEKVLQVPSRQSRLPGEAAVPFTVAVRVGQRLEPWIEAVVP